MTDKHLLTDIAVYLEALLRQEQLRSAWAKVDAARLIVRLHDEAKQPTQAEGE